MRSKGANNLKVLEEFYFKVGHRKEAVTEGYFFKMENIIASMHADENNLKGRKDRLARKGAN